MNAFLKIAVTCIGLVGALGVLPRAALADEDDRPAPPAQIDRDHDHDRDRGERGEHRRGHDRDWRRDHWRWERDRAEHERACHEAWERGASPERLHRMRCS